MNNEQCITIRLTRDGELDRALHNVGVYRPETVRKLIVNGEMSGWHLGKIAAKMGETLREVDLSKAIIQENYWWSSHKFPALISISFPAVMSEIRGEIFKRMYNLTEIEVHPDNPKFLAENNIVFSKDKTKLVRFPTGHKGDYTVPDFVTKIGAAAFAGCKGLTSVTIPKSVTSLKYNAFADCTELTSVEMPKKLKYLQNKVFENCPKLPQFIELQNKIAKQEKIEKIQVISAHDWVDNLLKNSKYPYRIESHHKTKLQLSVKINNKLKLEMPISLKHFQTIIPNLMATIERYDACINESELDILVERVAYDNRYSYWKNDKKEVSD
ncbi:MAG: leucine-rich repeat domain-containing protein [Marinilabiliaceae bacterium]|nr:leucine-rich repeat domain-containing protein [Marinilabiliaceae bacterium]